MKQNKWINLGEKVDKSLFNNIDPSLRHFNIAAKKLGISSICAQRSWNIYKGYIKESKHKIEHPQKDNIEKINKYIKEDDLLLEGNILELTEKITKILKG